ncbi:F-box only protein 15-like isoform X2 [Dunckerocampus dactyliophorus]|uniref:F-box only protein 15-like isoform X2 n=1 Tax=Dunckerocampus dactyliophorus TaxID=161453 RepID=UPI002405D1AF|nr:F-box only protein 15-like isoform X2 [Dunckerocampus dactyliophorus]
MAASSMATGEFVHSFMEGLARKTGRTGLQPKPQPQPVAQLCRRKSRPGATVHRAQERTVRVTQVKSFPSLEIVLDRLPSEILMKILSHLDPASLMSLSHVNKLFHRLANDDVAWCKIYMAAFPAETWRLKSTDNAAGRAEPQEGSSGGWKKKYLWKMGGEHLGKWGRELGDVNPFTGLPQKTEWILRNIVWELTVLDVFGRVVTPDISRVSFFSTSVTLCWSGNHAIQYPHISSIRLCAVRRDALRRPSPLWGSLIWRVDTGSRPDYFLGKDRLVQVMRLSPGLVLGFWRGRKSVAFIMVNLHLHRLVERSLLGSPVSPYWEPEGEWRGDLMVRTYALHFVLHNSVSEVMVAYFHPLVCKSDGDYLVKLRAISTTNLSQHRLLLGPLNLPWESEALEGSVEMCCVMVLTLQEEVHKPLWCVSTPVCVKTARKPACSDYVGKHFLLDYKDVHGKVRVSLVWLKEQKQFFIVSLVVRLFKDDKHFSARART